MLTKHLMFQDTFISEDGFHQSYLVIALSQEFTRYFQFYHTPKVRRSRPQKGPSNRHKTPGHYKLCHQSFWSQPSMHRLGSQAFLQNPVNGVTERECVKPQLLPMLGFAQLDSQEVKGNGGWDVLVAKAPVLPGRAHFHLTEKKTNCPQKQQNHEEPWHTQSTHPPGIFNVQQQEFQLLLAHGKAKPTSKWELQSQKEVRCLIWENPGISLTK